MKHIICLIDCQAIFTYNCCETAVMGEPRGAAQPHPEAFPGILLLRPLLFAASKAMGPPWEASLIVVSSRVFKGTIHLSDSTFSLLNLISSSLFAPVRQQIINKVLFKARTSQHSKR